jgi:hypothetical protein
VGALERMLQQCVVEQIDLAHGKIVGGPPPAIECVEH